MKIIIDLHEQQLSSVVSDGVFYAQTETTIDLATQSGEEGAFNGVSCALLAPDGVTLAHAIASEKKAILNTNTEECVKFIEGSSIDSERIAFLAIGDSDKPLAILPVAIKRNPLANVAPPAELAPTYPTSESLLAILSQMTAQAQRAEDAVEAIEKAQKAVAQYVDVTFPTKVTEAEKTLENATTSGVNSVTQRANQAVGALAQEQAQIISNIDTKAKAVNSALDSKIATANTAINDAVGKAETAKTDAVKAQGEASKSAEQASTSASNASASATNAQTSETNAKASATQAENATALKVDNRVIPTDDGEFPLVNVINNDWYQQIAPVGFDRDIRYWCDGCYHYFSNYTQKMVYLYDMSLKFVKRFAVALGAYHRHIGRDVGFITKVGDYFFVRAEDSGSGSFNLKKYNLDGTYTNTQINIALNAYPYPSIRIFRNERNNHIVVFGRFNDTAEDGSKVSRIGYNVYDTSLSGIIKKGTINASYPSDKTQANHWLNGLNVTGNTTFIAFADKDDETKSALYYFDKNDDLVSFGDVRGRGTFTVGGETRNYFVPRFFYNQRNTQMGEHEFTLTNGYAYYRFYVGFTEAKQHIVRQSPYSYTISATNVPKSCYSAGSFCIAIGGGTTNGDSSFSMPYVICSNSNFKLFKNANNGDGDALCGYAEYVVVPWSIRGFFRKLIGNTCIVSNTASVSRNHLMQSGDWDEQGGAVKFVL